MLITAESIVIIVYERVPFSDGSRAVVVIAIFPVDRIKGVIVKIDDSVELVAKFVDFPDDSAPRLPGGHHGYQFLKRRHIVRMIVFPKVPGSPVQV